MADGKPPEAIWQPIEDLPPDAERRGSARHRERAQRWMHPFQDGNGRMARLLTACVFARNGECPPIIAPERRDEYIRNLERADRGDLRPFIEFLAVPATANTMEAVGTADDVLQRRPRRRHGNGGVTARDRDGAWRYRPPGMTPRERLILEGRAALAPGEDRPDRAADST